jgi:2-polyprenyl-3-methyl-5-hydroxy-6-metoxy-1,4-benzoquinol methylase
MKNCNVCNSENVEVLIKEKTAMRCKNCNAVFKEKTDIYKERFNNEQNVEKGIRAYLTSIISKRFWKVVSDQYMNYLLDKSKMKFKTVLEVGSAYGYLIKIMNGHGINAEGIEASDLFINSLVTKNIQKGYFDESYKTTKKYDLICFTQMIYYFQNPISVLSHAKKMLNDEGIIFIATHNPSSSVISEKKMPQLIENGMTVILSKKNFKELGTIGLKLIDYSTFEPHMYIDRIKGNGDPLEELKNYFKYFIKKAYSPKDDGHIAFLILKSTK